MTSWTKGQLWRLIVVGLLASAAVHGAYGAFLAQTSNRGGSVANGTLTLDNTVGTGAACLSLSGAVNVNKNCDVLLNAATLWYPVSSPTPNPGEASVTNVAITDTGSLPASKLSVYMPACTK